MKLDVDSAYSKYMGVGKYFAHGIEDYFKIVEQKLFKHENGLLIDLIGPFSICAGNSRNDLVMLSDMLQNDSIIFGNNLKIQEGIYHTDRALISLYKDHYLDCYDVNIEELYNLIDVIIKH